MTITKKIIGNKFTNKKENCIAEPISEVKSNNNDKRYLCNLYNKKLELIEIKTIQKCNLISGSFNFSSPYYDKAVYQIARAAYDHMKERIRKRNCYKNVVNGYRDFLHFYNTIIDYLEKYPQYYAAYVFGHLSHDKDLKAFLCGIPKEYSERTLTLMSTQDNNAVRSIINRDISNEEKIKLLLSILERIEN